MSQHTPAPPRHGMDSQQPGGAGCACPSETPKAGKRHCEKGNILLLLLPYRDRQREGARDRTKTPRRATLRADGCSHKEGVPAEELQSKL